MKRGGEERSISTAEEDLYGWSIGLFKVERKATMSFKP